MSKRDTMDWGMLLHLVPAAFLAIMVCTPFLIMLGIVIAAVFSA